MTIWSYIVNCSIFSWDYGKKQRNIKFDIIRTFAILCVILCHSVEAIFDFSQQGWDILNNSSRIFMFVTFTIGRLGVPLFLLLSGALLLRKSINDDNDLANFYKRSLLSLFIVNEIWVVIYNIFFVLTGQIKEVTVGYIIMELLCLHQVPAMQIWYFPMILGIYLGIPLVIKIINSFSFKSLSIILGVIFISEIIFPTLQVILSVVGVNESYQSLLSPSYLGSAYGLYIILGYYLVNKNKIFIKKIYILIITLVNFFFAVFMQLFAYSNFSKVIYGYNIWYNNVFLFVCSIGIFILFNKMNDLKIGEKLKSYFTYISKISLSIFFIHYIVQYFLVDIVSGLNIIGSLKVIILFSLVFIISTAIIYILSKIDFISKYILRIK